MTRNTYTEARRRLDLENAIASGELEGFSYTPAMRDLLERSSRGLITEAEFDRAVRELANAND